MSFGGFNPNQCGDTNPNVRLAEHLAQNEARRNARNLSQNQRNASSGVICQHMEDNTMQNFHTFRADELLREIQQLESRFDSSLLPSANIIAPNVNPGRDWFFNQAPPPVPPQPFSSPSVPSQSLPSQSLSYPSLPPTHFYRNENIPHPIYPPHPMLPPHVSRYSHPPATGFYHPQSVMPVLPHSDLRPVQATVEDIQGSCYWSDIRGVGREFRSAEASPFFRDNEEGISTGNSNVEQGVDFGFLQTAEGSNSNTQEMGSSGFDSTQRGNNSKYVELLKRNQVQLNEEESFEPGRGDQAHMEELRNSNPPGQIFADDTPGFEVQEEENFSMEFLKKFSGFLSSLEDMNKYHFKEENPMLESEDPFQEGLKRLEVGDIPSAVLCFEAAVQIQRENAEAWQYLGTTQAANEQDVSAIAALKECLKLEPENLTALMALAVSYTNESFGNLAVIMLWKWLYHNPKYSDLVVHPPPENFNNLPSFLIPDLHKRVKDLFIMAANKNPTRNLDPDVQCALGVLFNLIGDCSKASDCFKAALSVNPEDARMWNRLGATLANGQRSEEAVEAYYRSLSLNPGYVRARYNLAVSCINLGAQKEAMMHLLKALNLQANTNTSRGVVGRMSDSIWTTVRIVLSQMGRQDMLPAVKNEDLDTLTKEFGFKREIGEA